MRRGQRAGSPADAEETREFVCRARRARGGQESRMKATRRMVSTKPAPLPPDVTRCREGRHQHEHRQAQGGERFWNSIS